jgi:streptogramin lyase
MSIKPVKRFHICATLGGWTRKGRVASMDLLRTLWEASTKVLSLSLFLLSMAAVLPAQIVTINYYPVPAPPNPRPGTGGTALPLEITAGPDGALWFTEQDGGKIGRITTTGLLTEYALPTPEMMPIGITNGPDGALWFTEFDYRVGYSDENPRIGRISSSGVITEYPLPTSGGHRLPIGITAGPDGALWFAQHARNSIGRIAVNGDFSEYPLPSGFQGSRAITTGPDGALWFTEGNWFGADKIGRITQAGAVTAYTLLPPNCLPTAITTGPDGALWVTDGVGRIGRVTTNGSISEYSLSSVTGSPGITTGPDGALWFTTLNGQRIGRITTAGVVTYSDFLSSGGWGITLGPDGNLWFTDFPNGRIGQVVLEDTTAPLITVSASPSILWPPNGRMVPVVVSGTIKDIGSGVLASSVEYAVTDEYHLVQPRGQMTLDSAGNYLFTILLRASREGDDQNGRRYTIRVSARDNAGNRAAKWQAIKVQHDRR